MGLRPSPSRVTQPFVIRKFQDFLDNQLPDNIFRAKGILWFDESPQRHIFHLSGKRFSIDDEDWKGEPKTQLVLIGQDLDHDKIAIATASLHQVR